ncbi:MAG: hypothetical protein IH880_02730 [Candidatus Marinimicrobia bacterium]|nr:hypothetical protein [Candidatus Neomarinimicrobiota bacterium]
MKKIAFFVEGQTEQIFVQSLIEFIAQGKNVEIFSKRGNLGRKKPRRYMDIDEKKIGTGKDYYVLITNSSSEDSIVSDIRELYQNLVKQGYSAIIGLRDVKPSFERNKIPQLRSGMHSSVSSLEPIAIDFFLSIMEVEAWFLAENTHFLRLSPDLTEERVRGEIGFFPDNNNAESLDDPSGVLTEIYALVGVEYDKSRAVVQRVVDELSFEDIKNIHSAVIPDLGGVVGAADNFLTS